MQLVSSVSHCGPCEALALLTLAGRRWVWGEARLLGLRGGEHGLTRHCAGSRVGSLLICMPCVVVHRGATSAPAGPVHRPDFTCDEPPQRKAPTLQHL
jgi:hypothetical protein